jgi:hypothetical protein
MNYRHFIVPGNQTREILANEQLFFLVGDVRGVFITSDYGEYDLANILADEHEHEHTGQIRIQNMTTEPKEVVFLQVNLK